jgi:hypothetical protein
MEQLSISSFRGVLKAVNFTGTVASNAASDSGDLHGAERWVYERGRWHLDG